MNTVQCFFQIRPICGHFSCCQVLPVIWYISVVWHFEANSCCAISLLHRSRVSLSLLSDPKSIWGDNFNSICLVVMMQLLYITIFWWILIVLNATHNIIILIVRVMVWVFFIFRYVLIYFLNVLVRAWPIAHLTDCSVTDLTDCFVLWEQPIVGPIVNVTDCLLNKPNLVIWLWTQYPTSLAA